LHIAAGSRFCRPSATLACSEQDSAAQLSLLKNARQRRQKRLKAQAERSELGGKENDELKRARKELAEIEAAAPVTNVFEDMEEPDMGGQSEPCPFIRAFTAVVRHLFPCPPRPYDSSLQLQQGAHARIKARVCYV
jgi:hypothetical protein